MKFKFSIFQPLFWTCRCPSWVCCFWAIELATNRGLGERQWIPFDQAVQIQTWLIRRIHAEQKLTCQVHVRVIEAGIALGEFASTPGDLEYFDDLRSLYDEGKDEALLIQIYQLDRKSVLNDDESVYDASSI